MATPSDRPPSRGAASRAGAGSAGAQGVPELEPRAAARILAWLAALYALVYLAPLNVRPLLAPDELRYAEIAREMLVSGDWVVPHLNGLRYFEKPVLGYWLEAAASAVLGLNAFAVRLPSALAVGATAWILFALARSVGGRRLWVLLVPAVYLTGAEVYGVGVFAVLDSLLALCVTGSLACFWWAYRAPDAATRRRQLLLCGVFWGLGVLAKGFVAVVIPGVAIAPFLLWERRALDCIRMTWLPGVVAAAVALPWALAIQLREPDFWRYFVMVEHFSRFITPSDLFGNQAEHSRPFWFLWPYALGGLFPWVWMIPAALQGRRGRALDPFDRYLACWFLGPLAFLSASEGKIGTYVLPCLAPLAVAIAAGLAASPQVLPRFFRAGALASAGSFALVLLLVGIALGTPALADLRSSLAELRAPVLCAGLALAAGCAAWAASARSPARALWIHALAPLPALALVPWVIPADASIRTPLAFVERNAPRASPGALVIADSPAMYAANLAFGRADLGVLRPGELDYGLSYADSDDRLVKVSSLLQIAVDAGREQEIALVVEEPFYARLVERGLPRPDVEERGQDLVFAVFRAPARR